MLTAQLEQAIAAFADCVDRDLNPELTAIRTPYDGMAEYDVVVYGRGVNFGVLHEDIVDTLAIASAHGGRAFIGPDGKLAIVWPLSEDDVPGPGKPEHKGLAEQERVAARGRRPRTKRS